MADKPAVNQKRPLKSLLMPPLIVTLLHKQQEPGNVFSVINTLQHLD